MTTVDPFSCADCSLDPGLIVHLYSGRVDDSDGWVYHCLETRAVSVSFVYILSGLTRRRKAHVVGLGELGKQKEQVTAAP